MWSLSTQCRRTARYVSLARAESEYRVESLTRSSHMTVALIAQQQQADGPKELLNETLLLETLCETEEIYL